MMDDTLIFPPKISFGAHVGPTWITEIVNTAGGQEFRNQPNANQRCKFDVGHTARNAELFTDVARFYWVCRGRLETFRFQDWSDYRDSDNHGTGVLVQLTASTYQCYKQYTAGASSYLRKIQKLYGTTTVSGSIDQDTGIVTSSGSPTPSGWSGTFHVPCRFDIDEAQFQIINRNVIGFIYGWDSIPIIEVPV